MIKNTQQDFNLQKLKKLFPGTKDNLAIAKENFYAYINVVLRPLRLEA
jgi:hypothetical protein